MTCGTAVAADNPLVLAELPVGANHDSLTRPDRLSGNDSGTGRVFAYGELQVLLQFKAHGSSVAGPREVQLDNINGKPYFGKTLRLARNPYNCRPAIVADSRLSISARANCCLSIASCI